MTCPDLSCILTSNPFSNNCRVLTVSFSSNARKFEVKTPDVVIKINPDRADLVETKVIDGRKYLLIEVGSNIQVNGVSLSPEKEE